MTKNVLFCLLLLVLLTAPPPTLGAGTVKLVVHPSCPAASLTKIEASRLFLRKTTRWSDSSKVEPIDQNEGSAARQALNSEIHNLSERQIAKYWQEAMFAGRARPPRAVGSDQAVLDFVASTPGSIGYISSATSVPENVKVLEIR
jgi:ABC-type phosphate transport system substrate-binding protein